MRLTLFTDYAFRLLIHAAATEPELITIARTAERFSISRNHLTKIANELVRGGYLAAVRGRNGGLRLAKPAHDIGIGDIVRFCESNIPLVECFDRINNKCVITPACQLKTILFDAEKAFYAVLSAHSLADLSARNSELRQILN
jgi:Rrf2 family nitric oxide-sensitive transcriptional repressor